MEFKVIILWKKRVMKVWNAGLGRFFLYSRCRASSCAPWGWRDYRRLALRSLFCALVSRCAAPTRPYCVRPPSPQGEWFWIGILTQLLVALIRPLGTFSPSLFLAGEKKKSASCKIIFKNLIPVKGKLMPCSILWVGYDRPKYGRKWVWVCHRGGRVLFG